MKLWRVTRLTHAALDGAGAILHGGRYSPPGLPVVAFASEAALAVLIALRYQPADPSEAATDLVLGWTEVDAPPERVPTGLGEDGIRSWVTTWLTDRRTLLAAVASKVLPEGDVVLFNPRHRDALRVGSLQVRPFNFAECLHTPPMQARFGEHL